MGCIEYNGKKLTFAEYMDTLASEVSNRANMDHAGYYALDESNEIDIAHNAWRYEIMSMIKPSEVLRGRLDMIEGATRAKVIGVTKTLFETIGYRNNIPIRFHREASKGISGLRKGWYSDGVVNFSESIITLDTYMHEFSHLWLKLLQSVNEEAYVSIMNKAREFLQTDSSMARAVHNVLREYKGENLVEEATALISGFVSLPAVMQMIGNEVDLANLDYGHFESLFSTDLKTIYDIVAMEYDISSTLDGINYQNSSLLGILQALTNDIINGKNIFKIYGVDYDNMMALNNLEGYMENAMVSPTAITFDETMDLLVDNLNPMTKWSKMEPGSIEMNNEIQRRQDNYLVTRENKYFWKIVGIELEVSVDHGKISPGSLKEIGQRMKTLSSQITENWIQVSKEIQSIKLEEKSATAADIIREKMKTSFGNPKFDIQTANIISNIIGFDGGFTNAMTIEDFVRSNPGMYSQINLNLFKDMNVMVVLHNQPDVPGDEVMISLFTLDKMGSFMNEKRRSNLFTKFNGMRGSEAKREGITYANNSSTISNMKLGIGLLHIMDKVKNVKILNLGTVEMSSSFKANLAEANELFNHIGYIKNIPELYNAIQNREIKSLIDKAHSKEIVSVQSYEDVLKSFFYHSAYYAHVDRQILAHKSRAYFNMTIDEKIDFIKKRLLHINDENSYEYTLLSKVLFELLNRDYTNLGPAWAGTYSNAFEKLLGTTVNIANPIVATVVQRIQATENLSIHKFRISHDRFTELLRPVWESKIINTSMQDMGSKRLQHMFMKAKTKEGIDVTLPYIWHSEHSEVKKMGRQAFMRKHQLNENDMALGDYVINQIEEVLITMELQNLRNAAVTKQHTEELKGDNGYKIAKERVNEKWNKSLGQVFVISKSANELIFSGEFKQGMVRMWGQTVDVNAIYNDIVYANAADTFRNVMDRQLDQTALLAAAGLKSERNINTGETIYSVIEKSINDKMSTNLETVFNYAILGGFRSLLHNNESQILFKAAKSYLKELAMLKSSQAEGLERMIEWLDNYYNAIVNNKRIKEEYVISFGLRNELSVDLAAGAALMGKVSTTIFLGYSPRIALKSAFFNSSKMLLFGIGNTFAGEQGLPNVTHFVKASAAYVANLKRVQAWGRHYQVANASAYEVMNSAMQNITKKFVLNEQVAHAMNQYTDEMFRHITMVAFMMKEGSWDAHTINIDKKGNERLVYDETKDKRMYVDGKITEQGIAIKEGIKKDLIRDGMMKEEDQMLPYGYDMEEAVMMKAIADKWVIGSYSAEASAEVTRNVMGQNATKFRRFMLEFVANMGLGTKRSTIRAIRFRRAVKDENGNWISKKEALDNVGVLQTLLTTGELLWSARKKGLSELKQLKPVDQANMMRMLTWTMISLLLKVLYGKFKDDDERREYYVDFHSLMNDTNTASQAQSFFESPFPAPQSLARMFNKIYKTKGADAIFYIPPTGRVSKEVYDIYKHINEE